MSIGRLLGRSSVLMAARFAGAGLAFAGNIAIARFLGADALGVFALCMAVASLIAVILPLGRQATATLFVSEYIANVHHGLLKGYLRNGYAIIWRMTAAAIGAGTVGVMALMGQVTFSTLLTVAFALAMAPALAFISFNGGVLTGARRQFSAFLPESLLKPAFILLAVFVSALAMKKEGSALLLGIICAGCWITAGTQVWLMRSSEIVPGGVDEDHDASRWTRTGWPWMFISLLWDYFIELHLLLAGLIATTAEIAVLHICFRLRVLAGFGMRALYALVLPDLYGANAREDRAALFSSLSRANALALGYAVSVCLGVWFVGEFALGLVDDSFKSAHGALMVMCMTMVARAVFGPATAVLAMKDHQLPSLYSLTGGLIVSVVLSLILFPLYGIMGIAIAYLAATSLISVVQWQLAWRLTGIDCSLFAKLRRTPEEDPSLPQPVG